MSLKVTIQSIKIYLQLSLHLFNNLQNSKPTLKNKLGEIQINNWAILGIRY